jgi:hypothetical protein
LFLQQRAKLWKITNTNLQLNGFPMEQVTTTLAHSKVVHKSLTLQLVLVAQLHAQQKLLALLAVMLTAKCLLTFTIKKLQQLTTSKHPLHTPTKQFTTNLAFAVLLAQPKLSNPAKQ